MSLLESGRIPVQHRPAATGGSGNHLVACCKLRSVLHQMHRRIFGWESSLSDTRQPQCASPGRASGVDLQQGSKIAQIVNQYKFTIFIQMDG